MKGEAGGYTLAVFERRTFRPFTLYEFSASSDSAAPSATGGKVGNRTIREFLSAFGMTKGWGNR